MKACVSHITQLVRFSNSLSSQLRNLTNTCNAPSELNWVLVTLSTADLSDNPLLWHWDHSGCEGRGFQVDLLPKTVGLLLLDLGFPHWWFPLLSYPSSSFLQTTWGSKTLLPHLSKSISTSYPLQIARWLPYYWPFPLDWCSIEADIVLPSKKKWRK